MFRPVDVSKFYRLIRLSSFIQKRMEKIIDHSNHLVYKADKSTETAVHNLLKQIKETLVNKEVALSL